MGGQHLGYDSINLDNVRVGDMVTIVVSDDSYGWGNFAITGNV